MLINGLKVVRLAVRLAWVTGTLALLSLIVLPNVLPALGHQVLIVRGASMEPAIPLGSIVVVHAVDPAAVSIGEVVTFRVSNGTVVTHRVTGMTSEGGLAFQTKGDANASADPVSVPASAVMGSVEYAVPGVGFLMVELDSVRGTIIAVVILGALLLVGWSIDRLVAAVGTTSLARTVARQAP